MGLRLCREHNRVVVAYAFRTIDTPIGVAGRQLLPPKNFPEGLAGALPSQDELEPSVLPADEAYDE